MRASVYSLALLPSRHFAFHFSVGRKILAELRLWHKTLAASLNRSCTASCYLPKQLSHFSFLRGQLLSLLRTSGVERKFLNPISWACFHMHSHNSLTSSLDHTIKIPDCHYCPVLYRRQMSTRKIYWGWILILVCYSRGMWNQETLLNM